MLKSNNDSKLNRMESNYLKDSRVKNKKLSLIIRLFLILYNSILPDTYS